MNQEDIENYPYKGNKNISKRFIQKMEIYTKELVINLN